MDNISIQGKLLRRLTFNPGLMLTGFRTTRPSEIPSEFSRVNMISSHVKITCYFPCLIFTCKIAIAIATWSLLKGTLMWCSMIEISSVRPRPRKSLVIFGKLRQSSEMFRNVRLKPSKSFGKSSEIFRKWTEIFRKSPKTSLLVCFYNKEDITCPLADMNFIFSCSTRYPILIWNCTVSESLKMLNREILE